MKKFIKKTIFLTLPILICFGIAEYLLRNIPNDYAYKNDYLDENAQDIETIFFGSSHTYYGVNPIYISGNAFNAGHISQSIDLDYEILHKYADKFENLKYIAMAIDYATLFGRTSTGIESWRIKNYNIYYNMNISNNLKNYLEVTSINLRKNIGRIIEYYINNINFITCSELGYGNIDREQKSLELTGIKAAKRHTKQNKQYFKSSLSIINNIIEYSKKHDIKIIFYTSPAYQTYVDNLDQTQLNTSINAIDSISSKHSNCYYFNLLTDKRFKKNDFYDADHLNNKGAKKMTLILNKFIETIK